ncbi:hypothetical protein [Nocardioides sp.]|uniref:hypothetical protein n=1 Tax=Nocardioides sp. TaxID=35761 RepID=UPI002B7D2A65|nr:hypothetical protein [Nocardioides sp.]HSX66764.1 hypothetical protein [Nocardioides sp.]
MTSGPVGTPFDTLYVLGIRSRRILEVDVETGAVSTFVDHTGPAPDGVVVSDRVYWTTMGKPTVVDQALLDAGDRERSLDYTARNGGVHAVDLSSGETVDVVPAGGITTGKQLALAGEWLYWGDREGMKVSRVRTDGTGMSDLVVNDGSGGVADWCVGVAVEGDHLYWTQKGPSDGDAGRILRTRISAAPDGEHEVLWDDLPEPIDLEVHDGYLYWTDRGAPPAGNTLNRAPLPAPGDAGADPEVLAGGFGEAIGLAVDKAAGLAYVTDLAGTIRVVPLPGSSAAERVLADLGEPLTGLAGTRKDLPA